MAVNEQEKDRVVFEIKKHIGVLAVYPTGWKKELNLVAWNNATPKYDLRDWDPEHKHMSRGITMHSDEMSALAEMLKDENF